MLEVNNLHIAVEGEPILKGLDLSVSDGEVHAIMGPNGSGKSTLAYAISGRNGYAVTDGSITLANQDLLAMDVTERALAGVFLGMQYPVEIPGVSNIYLLKEALNAQRKHRGEDELDAYDFMERAKKLCADMEMDESFLKRGVNEGFSGGEKKRNEILQMRLLEPTLAVLDETDSGLDIDALKVVADGINAMRSPERAIVLITHYQRLLDYVQPDHVHVLVDGRLVKSGGPELAQQLEADGYDAFLTTHETA
ncbi:MAG: Fe-S cluster assembly ATPase SufC [Gammaproteobacteria bacterium]|nr:Fe-S cluster assembly ATPase SufC [Gammaproteobacteria bacterium]